MCTVFFYFLWENKLKMLVFTWGYVCVTVKAKLTIVSFFVNLSISWWWWWWCCWWWRWWQAAPIWSETSSRSRSNNFRLQTVDNLICKSLHCRMMMIWFYQMRGFEQDLTHAGPLSDQRLDQLDRVLIFVLLFCDLIFVLLFCDLTLKPFPPLLRL